MLFTLSAVKNENSGIQNWNKIFVVKKVWQKDIQLYLDEVPSQSIFILAFNTNSGQYRVSLGTSA